MNRPKPPAPQRFPVLALVDKGTRERLAVQALAADVDSAEYASALLTAALRERAEERPDWADVSENAALTRNLADAERRLESAYGWVAYWSSAAIAAQEQLDALTAARGRRA